MTTTRTCDVVETTEAAYNFALEVLPPIYAPGCFAVSEPVYHEADGTPGYHWFKKSGDRFLACCGTRAQALAAFAALVVTNTTVTP